MLMSSSRNSRYSPDAAAAPRLRARAAPRLSCRMTISGMGDCSPADCSPANASQVPSVDPSTTTMSSQGQGLSAATIDSTLRNSSCRR